MMSTRCTKKVPTQILVTVKREQKKERDRENMIEQYNKVHKKKLVNYFLLTSVVCVVCSEYTAYGKHANEREGKAVTTVETVRI